MKKKTIGVQTKEYGGWGEGVIPVNYEYFFSQFGNVHPIDSTTLLQVDLLVLIGGADVWPGRYGERPQKECGQPDTAREFFDVFCLPEYMRAKIPIFGICRGHQTFAVANGMKLIQHVDHERHQFNLTGSETVAGMPVNSLHHQVVKETDQPALYSDQYGTIEAIEYEKYPAVTVQWHPELIYDEYSMTAVEKLLYEKTSKTNYI